jgi:rubrerythrin
MTLEDAITTALEYENRVRDVYRDSVARISDETGRRIIEVLADDEQRHVDYLNAKLEEWKKNGKITVDKLETTVPPQKAIRDGVSKLEKRMSDRDYDVDREILKKAVDVETETSEFYKDVIGKLDGEGQKMFQRFLEIEEGHLAIVQAELDYVTGTGYWFDFNELSMED